MFFVLVINYFLSECCATPELGKVGVVLTWVYGCYMVMSNEWNDGTSSSSSSTTTATAPPPPPPPPRATHRHRHRHRHAPYCCWWWWRCCLTTGVMLTEHACLSRPPRAIGSDATRSRRGCGQAPGIRQSWIQT